MAEVTERRFRTLRKRTKALLEGGEQSSVEFKTQVPGSIANQAAAGANYVALNPSVDVYTIVLGVDEETMVNGASRGRVVGCLDKAGSVQDLDQLRLQVEQKIRDAVTPPPQVEIFEEMTGTATPILVVEVRPTDPPHRVGDWYQVRGAGGVQAMTQHDALLLFRNKRTQAWIDELESSNPLLSILSALQGNYEDLAFRVSDAAQGQGDEPLEHIQRGLWDLEQALREVGETLGELQHESEQAVEAISTIEGHAESLLTAHSSSPEAVWQELRNRREMRWLQVNQHASLGRYPAQDLALIELMVREHFGAEPHVSDYAANLAELQGYNLTFSADSEPQPHLELVAAFVSAAVSRAERVPMPFSADWITEGIASRRDFELDAELLAKRPQRRPPARPFAREAGILELRPEGAQALASHKRATTPFDAPAIIWRTDQGALRFARTSGGRTVPVLYQPTWGTDRVRRGKPKTTTLGRELQKLVAELGGRLLLIEGPGVMLGTSTSRDMDSA